MNTVKLLELQKTYLCNPLLEHRSSWHHISPATIALHYWSALNKKIRGAIDHKHNNSAPSTTTEDSTDINVTNYYICTYLGNFLGRKNNVRNFPGEIFPR